MRFRAFVTVVTAVLLTSCTNVATLPTTTPAEVATKAFPKTVAPPSTTPRNTVTPKPSTTLTETPDLSKPYAEILFTEKLASLVLHPEDVPRLSPEAPDVMDPNYPQLIQPKVQDLTREIENCGKDCVKMVWKSKKAEGVGDRQVTIVMNRMETAQQAAELVSQSFAEFSQVESDMNYMDGDIYYPDQLPKNSKVGVRFKEPNVEIAFTTSRGPVYLMVTYNFQTEGDLNLDFGSVQNLAILQLSKLKDVGYPE
jgi:hypothetical protein